MNAGRFARLKRALERRQPDLTVLMDRVNKSHNFSAILRNCDAAGVLEVHVVPPEGGLDLHHHTSAGTKKWVRVRRHQGVRAASEHLKELGMHLVAAHPGEGAVDYRDFDYTRPTAIMMGAELHGVSEEGLSLADTHVAIPMMGMVRSLNVSVATSILLFEAFRQRQAAGMYESSRISPDELDRLLFEWSYPTVASKRRHDGRPYPALDDEGQMIRDTV